MTQDFDKRFQSDFVLVHYAHSLHSGIGLETTILFLREGASVLMTDILESALAKAMSKAKEMAPHMIGKVETMKCDVSKEANVEAVVERLDDWGGVDIMFNNAGIMHGDDDGRFNSSSTSRSSILTDPRRNQHSGENLGPHPKHQRQRRLVR